MRPRDEQRVVIVGDDFIQRVLQRIRRPGRCRLCRGSCRSAATPPRPGSACTQRGARDGQLDLPKPSAARMACGRSVSRFFMVSPPPAGSAIGGLHPRTRCTPSGRACTVGGWTSRTIESVPSPGDAAAFRAMRLRAGTDTRSVFHRTGGAPRRRDRAALSRTAPSAIVFGAFDGANGPLLGTIGIRRETSPRVAQVLSFDVRRGPMHVTETGPQADPPRLEGNARCRGRPGATRGERRHGPARALYASEGFVTYGVEPDALRLDGRSYAEEHTVEGCDDAVSRDGLSAPCTDGKWPSTWRR